MSWLSFQIWIELLFAAALGGGIGWVLHTLYVKRGAIVQPAPPNALQIPSPEGRERIAELEAKLDKAEAEADDLRRKSGIMPLGYRGQPPEGSLAWRNRILESRVRFLEGKLADLEAEGVSAQRTEEQNDEATRLHWRNRYLEGRVKYLEEELVRTGGLAPTSTVIAAPTAARPEAQAQRPSDENKPELFAQPRDGRADDLKMISGIGPKLEQKLNGLGVWHWAQIASWTPKEIEWVNAEIGFRGRIEREKWISQAIALLERGQPGALERAAESNGV
jgi:predicted flap endonuclease-1-like 5' DNA nuclease